MNLEIFLTTFCNYKCNYCTLNTGKLESNFNSLDTIKKLNNMYNFNNVDILGGEPLLHPDINDILFFLESINKNVVLYSNASNQSIKNIKYYNNLKFIFSFHESQVDFKAFLNNIKKVKNIFEVVIMVENILNYKKYLNYFNILKSLGYTVYLEGVYTLEDNKINLNILNFLKKDYKKTRIGSLCNEDLKMYYYDIFNIIDKPKVCDIFNYNITFDYKNNTIHKCLSKLYKKELYNTETYCDEKLCAADFSSIRKINV